MIRRCLAVTCPNLRSWMRWGVYGKWGGFLDRREQAFDWTAFEALLSPIHASSRGGPGYPPLTMFKTAI